MGRRGWCDCKCPSSSSSRSSSSSSSSGSSSSRSSSSQSSSLSSSGSSSPSSSSSRSSSSQSSQSSSPSSLSSSSKPSSSSSSAASVGVPCCVQAVPFSLVVSITASNCTGILVGDYTVSWNSTKNIWYYTGGGITICFYCVAGAFFGISVHCSENFNCTNPMGNLSGTCSPFSQSGTITVSDGSCGCSGAGTITVSVTGT